MDIGVANETTGIGIWYYEIAKIPYPKDFNLLFFTIAIICRFIRILPHDKFDIFYFADN